MYNGLHVKYPLILSDFNGTWNFRDRFSKNPQISSFMKIRPVGDQLFFVDGRTVRQTGRQDENYQSLFAILRTRLKTMTTRGGGLSVLL